MARRISELPLHTPGGRVLQMLRMSSTWWSAVVWLTPSCAGWKSARSFCQSSASLTEVLSECFQLTSQASAGAPGAFRAGDCLHDWELCFCGRANTLCWCSFCWRCFSSPKLGASTAKGGRESRRPTLPKATTCFRLTDMQLWIAAAGVLLYAWCFAHSGMTGR